MSCEILLVDDDLSVVESMSALLKSAGYDVRAVPNGLKAIEAIKERRPSLLLLDVMMPVLGGIEACREIRKADPSLPIAFLTSLETGDAELEALAAGGDLFISKSESDRVLLARLAALLRPREALTTSETDFTFASWYVEVATLTMRSPSRRMKVEINDHELFLMRLLAKHPGEVFSREALVERLWKSDSETNDNALSGVISRLRRKLGRYGASIKSIRGIGYVYRP